ncbi:MAG: hypothetical protein ABSF21_00265 [Dehalococcoidia bacterium]|jgi:hypothetical protein
MLNQEEFEKRILSIPGVTDDGHGNFKGLRLLTPPEREERQKNAQKIQKLICLVCGVNIQCGGTCILIDRKLSIQIAAMIPIGIKLNDAVAVKVQEV